MRMPLYRWLSVVVCALAGMPTAAQACGWCLAGGPAACGTYVRAHHCGVPNCGDCGSAPHLVEKVVMVPEWSKERRKITVTEYVPEQREHKYTVTRRVPETKAVEQKVVVQVPVTKTKKVVETVYVPEYRDIEKKYVVSAAKWENVEREVTVHVPVWEEVEQKYQVMVPHQEIHQGVRTVCKMVPVTETRRCTVDQGHWEQRVVQVPCVTSCMAPRRCFFRRCGGCGRCQACAATACKPAVVTTTCRVWVPHLVEVERPVTVLRPQWVEETYEYPVTVCRLETHSRKTRVCRLKPETRKVVERVCRYVPEERTKVVRVCEMKAEQREREVKYTVFEPKEETRIVQVTTCKTITEERTEMQTVHVPRQVEKEVEIDVCRMVPKTITVPADACGPAPCVPCGRAFRLFRCGVCN